MNETQPQTGGAEQPLDSFRLFRVRFDPELQCQVRELLGEYAEEAQAISQLDMLRSQSSGRAGETYEIARHAPPAYWFFQQRQLRHATRSDRTPQQRTKRKPRT